MPSNFNLNRCCRYCLAISSFSSSVNRPPRYSFAIFSKSSTDRAVPSIRCPPARLRHRTLAQSPSHLRASRCSPAHQRDRLPPPSGGGFLDLTPLCNRPPDEGGQVVPFPVSTASHGPTFLAQAIDSASQRPHIYLPVFYRIPPYRAVQERTRPPVLVRFAQVRGPFGVQERTGPYGRY